MLNRTEKYFLPGSDPEPRLTEAARYLALHGFNTTLIPPTRVSGVGPDLGRGLHLTARMNFEPIDGGISMDVNLKGNISSGRLATIVVLMLVFFPAGIALAFHTLTLYRKAAPELMTDLHRRVRRVMSVRPKPQNRTSGTRIRSPYVSGQSAAPPARRSG